MAKKSNKPVFSIIRNGCYCVYVGNLKPIKKRDQNLSGSGSRFCSSRFSQNGNPSSPGAGAFSAVGAGVGVAVWAASLSWRFPSSWMVSATISVA